MEGVRHFPIPLAEEMDAETEWFVEMEILWAPDSSAVSFAWNTTAITESSQIYAIGPEGVRSLDLSVLMADFAGRWPPCVGAVDGCRIAASGKDYNYLTVAWASPHTVVIMAEVPPSGSFGANLGKVVGYEVDAGTGNILRAMSPKEFKQRWQSRMGWNFNLSSASGY